MQESANNVGERVARHEGEQEKIHFLIFLSRDSLSLVLQNFIN